AFLDQHVDDIARHAGADVARRTGLLALAAAGATDEIVQRLEHHLFGHTVDGQEEVALALALHANAGEVDAVAFTVHVDDELGRHALTTHRGTRVAIRDRQQHFGRQGAGFAFLEELAADVGEHRVGQHVLFALGQFADFLAQPGQLGRDQVGGAHFDDLLATNGLTLQLGVDGALRLAVAALQVELHLVGDALVALAGEHVEYGLGADDLRGRGDQRREAEVFAHPRDFGEDLVDTIQRPLVL